MDERALVKACVEGNYRAQKKLYTAHSAQMMGICMRYSSCVADAEDILQEGFISVYRNLHSYAGTGPLAAWMRRVMINTALQLFRQKKKMQVLYIEDGNIDMEEVSNDVLSSLGAQALMEKLQQLPDGFRTVFNLYAIEGFRHSEIAVQLGISEGTSKSQYSRARAHLRKMIEQENRISEKAF